MMRLSGRVRRRASPTERAVARTSATEPRKNTCNSTTRVFPWIVVMFTSTPVVAEIRPERSLMGPVATFSRPQRSNFRMRPTRTVPVSTTRLAACQSSAGIWSWPADDGLIGTVGAVEDVGDAVVLEEDLGVAVGESRAWR